MMVDAANRQDSDTDAALVVRGLRRQELLRTAFADLLGRLTIAETGLAISRTTEATLDAALQVRPSIGGSGPRRRRAADRLRGHRDGPPRRRRGGLRLRRRRHVRLRVAGSTCPTKPAARIAHDVAERMRTLLSAPSGDPPLGVDADLRPEGRNGPLVRSLASYAGYYARWSSAWEAQALLRARFAVGDVGSGGPVHRADRSGALPGHRR